MLETIFNLRGVEKIEIKEQKNISGGSGCAAFKGCDPGYHYDLAACECVKSLS